MDKKQIISESITKLNELCALEKSWDGYDGLPVRFSNAHFAMQILDKVCSAKTPQPSIVPCSDGGLQIEWHINGFDIELYIKCPRKIYAWRGTLEDEEGEEIEIITDSATICSWLREMEETL